MRKDLYNLQDISLSNLSWNKISNVSNKENKWKEIFKKTKFLTQQLLLSTSQTSLSSQTSQISKHFEMYKTPQIYNFIWKLA